MTPLDADNLAENVRRLAGLHLMSLEQVAEAAGISRAGMMKIVASDPTKRSYPKAETAIKLADLFGVSLNDLYSPPEKVIESASRSFLFAPVRTQSFEWPDARKKTGTKKKR
jgi:transcriptional regulator with XRE-family HTH domain